MSTAVGKLRDEMGELEARRRETESARHYQGRESYSLVERLEVLVRVLADASRRRAEAHAEAERGAIYYRLGITEHICGVDNVQSLCNLTLLTGHVGREGTGINPMRGQNNIQGAGDAGALPNNYPGFQPVSDPANQARFEEAWGVQVDLEKGMTKVRALDLAGEKILGMLICGENTVVSDPDVAHCRRALESLDHLVVIDMFLTETAQLADVVLPAAGWGEKDGTFINSERRLGIVRKVRRAPGQALADFHIFRLLAEAWGCGPLFERWRTPEDVMARIRPQPRSRMPGRKPWQSSTMASRQRSSEARSWSGSTAWAARSRP